MVRISITITLEIRHALCCGPTARTHMSAWFVSLSLRMLRTANNACSRNAAIHSYGLISMPAHHSVQISTIAQLTRVGVVNLAHAQHAHQCAALAHRVLRRPLLERSDPAQPHTRSLELLDCGRFDRAAGGDRVRLGGVELGDAAAGLAELLAIPQEVCGGRQGDVSAPVQSVAERFRSTQTEK